MFFHVCFGDPSERCLVGHIFSTYSHVYFAFSPFFHVYFMFFYIFSTPANSHFHVVFHVCRRGKNWNSQAPKM